MELPPLVRGVVQKLSADGVLMALLPGGVHTDQGRQDLPLPCVLVTMPAPVDRTGQFGPVPAYAGGLVYVHAKDESKSAIRAQAIADRCHVVLERQALELGPDWLWMDTKWEQATIAGLQSEGDLTYQQRGAAYRVLASPIG